MLKAELETATSQSLDAILLRPDLKKIHRCHEIARLLGDELNRNGYSGTVVKDGTVDYDLGFLLRNSTRNLVSHFDGDYRNPTLALPYPEDILDLRSGNLSMGLSKRDLSGQRTIRTTHSWLEMGDRIIDYHPLFEPVHGLKLWGLLIVLEMDTINGGANYNPIGREFGIFGIRFVYIPPSTYRIAYIVKLRI